jgi:hypothetical protein
MPNSFWGWLSSQPRLAQIIGALFVLGVALPVLIYVLYLGSWVLINEPYRGFSLGPKGFQITPRQDPGLARCQAAAKGLADVAASSAKTVSDLTSLENSAAERVSSLEQKYIDDKISELPAYMAQGQRSSPFLNYAMEAHRRVVEARETAQRRQADLLAKVDEINRVCETLSAPTRPATPP